MGRNLVYSAIPMAGDAATNTTICNVQNVADNGKLLFNGSITPNLKGVIDLVGKGASRSVLITTAGNYNGSFTVIGIQNGINISATLNGADGTRWETQVVFDQVVSISSDIGVNNVSVGVGSVGFFPPIVLSPDSSKFGGNYWSVFINGISGNDSALCNPQLFLSLLDDVRKTIVPFITSITKGEFIQLPSFITNPSDNPTIAQQAAALFKDANYYNTLIGNFQVEPNITVKFTFRES